MWLKTRFAKGFSNLSNFAVSRKNAFKRSLHIARLLRSGERTHAVANTSRLIFVRKVEIWLLACSNILNVLYIFYAKEKLILFLFNVFLLKAITHIAWRFFFNVE